MLTFNSKSSSAGNLNLMPAGTLALARIDVRGIKLGKENSTRYAECQFKIEGGEFNNRTFFSNVNDPTDQPQLPPAVNAHSEGGRRMGFNAIARMVEASGLVRIGDEASYNAVTGTFEQIMGRLHGRLVAVKIGIEKGKGSYADKNVVQAYLSPNPDSDGYKGWQALKNGSASEHDASLAGAVQSWGGQATQPNGAAPAVPSQSRDLTKAPGWVQPPADPQPAGQPTLPAPGRQPPF